LLVARMLDQLCYRQIDVLGFSGVVGLLNSLPFNTLNVAGDLF